MERKSFFGQIRMFILESDAVASLQTGMMCAEIIEPLRPLFVSLDIEYELNNIKNDWYRSETKLFFKRIDRARR